MRPVENILNERKMKCAAAAPYGPIRGILWAEWLANRKLLTIFFTVWLVGVWILVLFTHPLWILLYGLAYAILVGQAIGGSDALAGTAELTHALPFTRKQLYVARALFAGLPLLFLVGIGVLAIRLDWPQALWGLVVESGFTEPFEEPGSSFPWTIMAMAIPVSVFAWTFVLSSLVSSARLLSLTWFAGLLATGTMTGLGHVLEVYLWNQRNGWIAAPLVLAVAAIVLVLGGVLFQRKEGVNRGAATGRQPWHWAVAIVLILVVVAMVLVSTLTILLEREHADKAYKEARRAAVEAQRAAQKAQAEKR